MANSLTTINEYIKKYPSEQSEVLTTIRETINTHIPSGFEECLQYKMLSRSVPLKTYPNGYHCTPNTPLPFLSLAYQKKSVNLYHMGIYSDQKLLQRFQNKRKNRVSYRLDMGKSCIRFKKYDQVPYDLIRELTSKMSVNQWITLYEKNIKR